MGAIKEKPGSDQLNVRSRIARERAAKLAQATGMTLAQVVEDALLSYHPALDLKPAFGLVEQNGVLVMPHSGRTISHNKVEADLDDIRSGARE